MKLDRVLINQLPVSNPIVENNFRRFPIYLRNESLRYHRYKMHVQPGIEINLSLAGTAVYVVGSRIYKTSPGHILLFPGHVPHQVFVDNADKYKRVVLCIDDAMLQAMAGSPAPAHSLEWFGSVPCHHIRLSMNMFALFKQIVQLMHTELMEQRRGWEQMMMAQLTSLSVMIGRMVDEQLAAYQQSRGPCLPEDLADRCCQYIESHLHEDLSLQSVAELFHVSPEHLTRTFKREKGVAFYQYVLLQRIQESKRLMLARSDISLTDIAYTLGFASSSHFSRIFKSVTAITPREFRHRSQSGL
ncbi:AraC family transcriptional regulator [Paenibacillus sp. GYB004]|uniref:helix-turn-helix transcriptional regulator n=1 Tax=Paenibacillus sp. GYB004 TaxID=2994393 RepID=UPI002F96156B